MDSDIVEGIADLEIGQMLRVLLENEGVISAVVAALQSGVDLVENMVWHIVEVIVLLSSIYVDHSILSIYQILVHLITN